MNANDLAAIHAELRHITQILYVVGALMLAAVVLACFRAYWVVRRHVDQLDTFASEAEALLEKQQLEKLAMLAAAKIRERPNYAYGYWYLARALYEQGQYSAAIEQFETARKMQPAWESNYIDPYVRETRRRMESRPHEAP